MYSMIATAPESVQQRRRLQFGSSPGRSPAKTLSSRGTPPSLAQLSSSSRSDGEGVPQDVVHRQGVEDRVSTDDADVKREAVDVEYAPNQGDLLGRASFENDDDSNGLGSPFSLNKGGSSHETMTETRNNTTNDNNATNEPEEIFASLSLLDEEIASSESVERDMNDSDLESRASPASERRRGDDGVILDERSNSSLSNVDTHLQLGTIYNGSDYESTNEDNNRIKFTRSWSIEPKVDDARSDADQSNSGTPSNFIQSEIDTICGNEISDATIRDTCDKIQNESSTIQDDERRLFQSPVKTNPASDVQASSSHQGTDFHATTIVLNPVEETDEYSNKEDKYEPKTSPPMLRARSGGVSLFTNSNSPEGTPPIIGNDDEVMISLPPRVSRSVAGEHSPLFYPSENASIDGDAEEREDIDRHMHGVVGVHQLQSETAMNSRPRYDHTHSLLDDCSDDEDEMTSVASSSYGRSGYSCFPKRQASKNNGSYYSYFKKQKHGKQSSDVKNSPAPSANEVASKNIQLCMLKTRHRRWSCQSVFAGSHAQSDQVLDLSHRVVHYPMRLASGRYGRNEQYTLDDDDVTLLARLSIPGAAIRAAALASGIWRTVRLVRLPRGLFGFHWLLYKEISGLQGWEFRTKGQQETDGGSDDNDVWSLLRMLGELFPMMDQIDFGGDVAHSNESLTAQNHDEVCGEISSKDNWKKEIRLRILKCLPNLIVIDGFDVVREELDAESPREASRRKAEEDKGANNNSFDSSFEEVDLDQSLEKQPDDTPQRSKSIIASVNSGTCVDCDTVEVSMCGWSDMENLMGSPKEPMAGLESSQTHLEASASSNAPDQCQIATDLLSSDAIEDVSENVMAIVDNSMAYSDDDNEADVSATAVEQDQMPNSKSADNDLPTSPSSSLLSSRSWSSNGSGNRPPPCPTSSSRSRLPSKPGEKKYPKQSLTKGKSWKRRVLGLIPSVSVMDEEDDDDENDVDTADDCPHDIL